MNGGFGKDFYRKGNSVKRSGPFSEPPGSELRGFGDVRGFPFCGGKKGLRLPLAMGNRV